MKQSDEKNFSGKEMRGGDGGDDDDLEQQAR